jgi:two-component system OmpR family sensor kinase
MTSIFERFVRGDESRDSHLGSTGLGLAIVQAVIEAHDGEVVATSTPGETRFRIRLRS